MIHSQSTPWPDEHLTPVVQGADNSIQWKNRYPADKMYSKHKKAQIKIIIIYYYYQAIHYDLSTG